MTELIQPKTVKALFTFKGTNNDELCFTKGDIITVTQVVDGGWWEGTLNGLTGWFPSNYVKEIKPVDTDSGTKSICSQDDISVKRESMMYYRNVVLQSLIDSEKTFVSELQELLVTYLRPLQGNGIVTSAEYSHLLGNLEEILSLHQTILTSLDDCSKLQLQLQRVGGIFMKGAPQVKKLYGTYCSNHPHAAAVIARTKDDLSKYMETKGATSPGHMTLTTGLSNPFTRLEKYPSQLKELERHTEESHPDRGDTQRAITVYKEITSYCTDVRREKEVELEILTSTIRGWEGEEISKLGEIQLIGHVKVLSDNGERKEHLLVGFSSVLVLLYVSPRRSGYTYEGKIPLSGLTINALDETEDGQYAVEIGGSMIDKRIMCCAGLPEQKQLIEGLRQLATQGTSLQPRTHQSIQVPKAQPSICQTAKAQTAKVTSQLSFNPFKGVWSMSCLRPAPPIRPSLLMRDGPRNSPSSNRKIWGSRRKPVDDSRTLEDDAQILKVIESYCTSAKTRHTVNSSILEPPHMIIPGEEKMIVEETRGDQTVIEEKSLVDTVYTLRDQVREIGQEQKKMRKDMDEEKKARKRLENLIRRSLRSLAETTWEETG